MKQVINNAEEFTLQLLKGVTRLCSVCVTFEGPVDDGSQYPIQDATGYAQDTTYKKTLNLWFPPGNREELEWWVQIGTDRMPVYPVRGMRECRGRNFGASVTCSSQRLAAARRS